jgi:outer membrane immunogenic protein
MLSVSGVRHTFLAAAVVAVAAISNPAVAADRDEIVYRPAITWTGFSVGVHGGYGQADIDFPGAPAYPAGPPRPDLDGGFVGIQGAAMVEINRLALGITADISFTKLNETVRDGNYLTETTKIDRFGTVRGVIGYSFGHFMPYATVGLAWADGSYGATCPDQAAVLFGGCSKPGPRSYNDSFTMTGIAWGGGIKYAINQHWSVGAEYVRMNFDDKSYTNGPLASWAATQGKITADYDSVRASVDYRF